MLMNQQQMNNPENISVEIMYELKNILCSKTNLFYFFKDMSTGVVSTLI